MTAGTTQSTVKNQGPPGARPVAFAGLLATLAAFLAAACCVLPFVFIALGLGGSWLAFLDNGLLYRQELQWAAGAILAAGWLYATGRRRLRGPVVRLLFLSTVLLIASVLIWEQQGAIRGWLMDMR